MNPDYHTTVVSTVDDWQPTGYSVQQLTIDLLDMINEHSYDTVLGVLHTIAEVHPNMERITDPPDRPAYATGGYVSRETVLSDFARRIDLERAVSDAVEGGRHRVFVAHASDTPEELGLRVAAAIQGLSL